MCSIHYIEQIWEGDDSSLNVWVNLGDLADGREVLGPQDTFESGLEGRDITSAMSISDRHRLFDAIRHVQISYIAQPAMGLDGSDHDLTITLSPTCFIRCHWWVDPPDEWQGVKEIVEILRRCART